MINQYLLDLFNTVEQAPVGGHEQDGCPVMSYCQTPFPFLLDQYPQGTAFKVIPFPLPSEVGNEGLGNEQKSPYNTENTITPTIFPYRYLEVDLQVYAFQPAPFH